MSIYKMAGFEEWGLPLWAGPLPDEPAHGLLFRLTEINGYPTVYFVLRETGLLLSQLRRGKQLDLLAKTVRKSEDDIARDSFVKSGRTIAIRGEEVGSVRDCDFTSRRVCPDCLRESPHHRFFWDLSFFSSCPHHKVDLIDRCSCDQAKKLTWRDGRLYRGNCCTTGDIRRVDGVKTDAAIVEMEGYFSGRLGITPKVPVPALDCLPLFEAAEALERIGALETGGYATQWLGAADVNLPGEVARARGYSVLVEDRMQEVLENVYNQCRESEPSRPARLTTAYGWFYHWYAYKGGKNFSPYLTDQIVRHAAGRFNITNQVAKIQASAASAETRSLLDEQQRNFCTISEAKKICGIAGNEAFRSLLGSFGLLRKDNRGGCVSLPRADMEALAKIRPHLITKTDAGAILGVSEGTAPRLLDLLSQAGFLTPFLNGPKPAPRTFRFLRQDIEDLWSRLEDLCRKDPPPANSISICGNNRIRVRYFCKALLSGALTDAWLDPKGGRLRAIRITSTDADRLGQMPWKRWENEQKPLETFVPSMDYWRERAKSL